MPISSSISRRSFLTRAACAAAAAPAFLRGQTRDAPPNIVFVTSDQMRGDAIRALGHPNVRTPNLDRMAREGVLFENCFANGPVCVPTRKSCFSGLYPHQHGNLTNDERPFLGWSGSMLEHFAERGYRTGWVGKNHTFERDAVKKLAFASIRDREPFRAYNGMVPPQWHTDVYWPEEDCYANVNTNAALNFIDQAKAGEPFFLHVSYFDPHPPYMAPAEYTSRYRSEDMRLPEYIPPERLSERLAAFRHAMGLDRITRADLTETMRYYYAQIEWGVDAQVGRLIETLNRKGLAENTIVMLTADHGDFMGEHGLVRKGMFLYDALLHVPLLWYAPERIARGHRSTALAQSVDFFPTLVELSGGKRPEGLVGRSLRPFLEGRDDGNPSHEIFTSAAYGEIEVGAREPDMTPHEAAAVPRHTQKMNLNMRPNQRMMMARSLEWKLIVNENRGPELYKMNGGWVERDNVAERREFASVRDAMEKRLRQWWTW